LFWNETRFVGRFDELNAGGGGAAMVLHSSTVADGCDVMCVVGSDVTFVVFRARLDFNVSHDKSAQFTTL